MAGEYPHDGRTSSEINYIPYEMVLFWEFGPKRGGVGGVATARAHSGVESAPLRAFNQRGGLRPNHIATLREVLIWVFVQPVMHTITTC